LGGAGKHPSARPARRGRRTGLAAFILLQDDVRKAIQAHHSLRWIHDQHQEALGVSYRQFTRYVGKYLKVARDDAVRPVARPLPAPHPLSPGSSSEPKRAASERQRAFVVNPMAMRSKDLI
jgi:uncharacterized protein DUF5338